MEFQVGPYQIILHVQPLEIMEHFAQYRRRAPESGGIVLGKLIDGQINVLKLSVPTSLDKSSRTNFERSKVAAQIIIEYEFHNSSGQLAYLGEWHTHPEDYPTPSSTDLNMLKDQYRNNKLSTDFILLIIRGIRGFYIRIVDKNGIYESKIRSL